MNNQFTRLSDTEKRTFVHLARCGPFTNQRICFPIEFSSHSHCHTIFLFVGNIAICSNKTENNDDHREREEEEEKEDARDDETNNSITRAV